MKPRAAEEAWRAQTRPMVYDDLCSTCRPWKKCLGPQACQLAEQTPWKTSELPLAVVIVACLAVPLALGPMFSLGPVFFNWMQGLFGGMA